ncbi:heme NO-binding domain-containing protein [Halopiger aswanensis]|uniref:Heme-NO-binding protein n=1 Tax=Halopiger aswanensis TaxID=148449 RepID=A0A419WEM5_9EURY|nr:heme NO-binding domain-containing protein [Halopiger aswanensis]RKD93930.1 heme-NO-binding protein [Halopiger aswanensis]
MHGIVHKTLETYVVDRTDEETWERVVDRADLEPQLYLQVSHYDDREIDAVLETLTELAPQDRRTIERGFGRTLAPELLSTFNAHIRTDRDILELLADLETVTAEIDAATEKASLPDVSSRRDGDEVTVTYETHRETTYCGLAHGVLEGLLAAFDADGTVTEQACDREDDIDACRFLVTIEDEE